MGKWVNRYTIGLTGNIGVGKSLVRKILEKLGAFGIDADSLTHQVMKKGTEGYGRIIQEFGQEIIDPQGEIDRLGLGRVVFVDYNKMIVLEGIVHPLVQEMVESMISGSSQSVIVIEAVKLIETGMHRDCDSLWVVTADKDVQFDRLVNLRKISETEAMRRIKFQSSQEEKISLADVVIENGGSLSETWSQVLFSWERLFGNVPHAESLKREFFSQLLPNDR